MFDQQESVLKLSVSATCDSGEPSIKSYFIPSLHTFLGLGIDPLSVLFSDVGPFYPSMLVIELTN